MASGRVLMAEPRGKASVARSTIAGSTGFVFHALGVDLQGDFTGCRNNRFGLSFRAAGLRLPRVLRPACKRLGIAIDTVGRKACPQTGSASLKAARTKVPEISINLVAVTVTGAAVFVLA